MAAKKRVKSADDFWTRRDIVALLHNGKPNVPTLHNHAL